MMVMALLLFVRERDALAAAVLAAATWTKFSRCYFYLSCCWTGCNARGGVRWRVSRPSSRSSRR